MYFIPLSTHVRESNLFQTLIYSSQGIQFILDLLSTHAKKSNDLHPYLFMSGNPMLQILTLNVGRNNLTLTPKPTLKRRRSLFCLMFIVLFFFSRFILDPYLLTLGNPMHFKPLSTHVRESN